MTELPSWNNTRTTQAIVEFSETAARDVSPEERVAVFDKDGALWSDKPMPIERVKTHMSHLLTRLDLRDRVQAVVFAYESGLAPS